MPVKVLTPSRAVIIITTAVFVSLFQLIAVPHSPQRTISVLNYNCNNNRLQEALKGPIPQDDNQLIEWVQGKIFKPSKEPYNLEYMLSGLEEEIDLNKTIYSPSQEFILDNIYDIFNRMGIAKKGFFVEAGAYDGEFLSNTLQIEKARKWTGLLVEPNKEKFEKLLTKHRKAYSINACLSTNPYPSQEMFTEMTASGKVDYLHNRHPGDVITLEQKIFAKNIGIASSRLANYHNASDSDFLVQNKEPVQCLPLYTLARALNINHIDLFSLDVEGAEMGILRSIPWRLLSFTMLVIEHTSDQKELVDYLNSKGYHLFNQQFPDYIFVNSKYIKFGKQNKFPDNKRKKYWN